MFAFLLSAAACVQILQHEEKSFLSFMRETNQYYTGNEYQVRLGIYLSNVRLVQDFNKANTFKVGINKFATYTPAEYKALLGALPEQIESRPSLQKKFAAPDNFDWRDKGAVCPIKDQAQCGSCWAFSAASAAESAWFIANNELISLSEQNLVDCVTSCYGCNGGWPYKTYDYVIKKQGGQFMREDDYPYTGTDGSCQWDSSKGVIKIKSYVKISSGDEDDQKEKIYQYGVASICIDASQWSFQMYQSGIYDEESCSSYRLNHAVNAVGYGVQDGTPYWIVRNSWGTSWGDKGYILMIRNKNNQCGVASSSVIPTC
ncbi:cysteine protease 8 [Histomonas meleagridis]|uniref:cysteine protease 8 n=1 Tax=Histomonas meleagridis TaxID=135588 RepID=UPI0035598542|nr:cysteine protease 8 [Histomonas meleagridis]KAH0804360.1 cysteine protease 8 [Histomonas meleagridis]